MLFHFYLCKHSFACPRRPIKQQISVQPFVLLCICCCFANFLESCFKGRLQIKSTCIRNVSTIGSRKWVHTVNYEIQSSLHVWPSFIRDHQSKTPFLPSQILIIRTTHRLRPLLTSGCGHILAWRFYYSPFCFTLVSKH